jgi:hypothetical protein
MSYTPYPSPPPSPPPFKGHAISLVFFIVACLFALLSLAAGAASGFLLWGAAAGAAGYRRFVVGRRRGHAHQLVIAEYNRAHGAWWASLNEQQRAQYQFDCEQAKRHWLANQMGIALPNGYVITDAEYIQLQAQARVIESNQQAAAASAHAAAAMNNAARASRDAATAAARQPAPQPTPQPGFSRESVIVRDNWGNQGNYDVTRIRR